MTRVYLSVGSNIERERNIVTGIAALRARFGALILSPLYESKACGFSGADFYNLVVGFDTDEQVQDVIRVLQDIESSQSRLRDTARFSSRTLDLDLLLYGELIMHEPGCVLPRPDILTDAFVLYPLSLIAPDARHPVNGQTFQALWAAFDHAKQELWPVA